jgi:hypothetical protein
MHAHRGCMTEAADAGHRALFAEDRNSPSAEDGGSQFARADCAAMDKALIALIVTFGLAFVMFAALAAGCRKVEALGAVPRDV